MAVIDDRTGARDYPLPNAANRVVDDVPRLREAISAIDADVAAVLLALAGKAAATHVHALADITGLVSALAGKAATNHVHALADLTDTDIVGAANGQILRRTGTKWSPAALTLGDISGWEATVAAMIAAEVDAVVGAAPGALDTLAELAAALGGDAGFAATVTTALGNRLRVDAAQALTGAQQAQGRGNLGLDAVLALLAPLASPEFSGAPTAPTPLAADNSTRLATTAWVLARLAALDLVPAKLSTASGAAPSFSARAWVSFDGTGVVTVLASGNVSSVSDGGVGLYTINFTTAMPDSNYAVIGSTRRGDGGSDTNIDFAFPKDSTYSASAVQVRTQNTSTFSTADADKVNVMVIR